jgi:hypothetical protein
MRKCLMLVLTLSWVALAGSARADFDLAGVALIGSGVDTGDEPHNPYAFQVGGELEMIINGFVVGGRVTRALTSGDVDRDFHLLAFGGDLGYEWELAIVHLGPRVAMGQVRQIDGDFKSFYVEPGAVVDIELGWFLIGAELRYRFVTENMDRSGIMALARIGLRF